MSKTGRYNPRRPVKGRNQPHMAEHHVTVRSVRRDPPDLQKLSRAVIAMGLADVQAEKAAAEAEVETAAATDEAANTSAANKSGESPSEEVTHD